MTVEPSWRITTSGSRRWTQTLRTMKDEGVLVPDTRLQTIADARSTTRRYTIEEWMDCAMLALDAATRIGEREGTHLHYANHDILIEAGEELRTLLLDALTKEST